MIKLEMFFIGALLFATVFIIGIDLISEHLSEYDVDVDTSDTFGKIADNAKQIYDAQADMKDDVQGGAVTEGNAEDDMFAGGYNAIRTKPFAVYGVAINASQTLFKETAIVPDIAVTAIAIILSTLILFAIIAIIFRFRT